MEYPKINVEPHQSDRLISVCLKENNNDWNSQVCVYPPFAGSREEIALTGACSALKVGHEHHQRISFFDHIRKGYTVDEFLADFPTVSKQQIERLLDLAEADIPKHSVPTAQQ